MKLFIAPCFSSFFCAVVAIRFSHHTAVCNIFALWPSPKNGVQNGTNLGVGCRTTGGSLGETPPAPKNENLQLAELPSSSLWDGAFGIGVFWELSLHAWHNFCVYTN